MCWVLLLGIRNIIILLRQFFLRSIQAIPHVNCCADARELTADSLFLHTSKGKEHQFAASGGSLGHNMSLHQVQCVQSERAGGYATIFSRSGFRIFDATLVMLR